MLVQDTRTLNRKPCLTLLWFRSHLEECGWLGNPGGEQRAGAAGVIDRGGEEKAGVDGCQGWPHDWSIGALSQVKGRIWP